LNQIPKSEITPEHLYLSRRQFIAAASVLAASTVLNACAPQSAASPTPIVGSAEDPPRASQSVDERGDALAPFELVTNFNNFYEFSANKDDVGAAAKEFRTFPWTVEVGGLVNKPRAFPIEELVNFAHEERIYRLRCVEAWSMVIPWNGFPLSRLLAQVEPQLKAKYVRFETLLDPKQMPGQNRGLFKWPYVEGLRLDEAMHDLTILATGIYGKPLPPQDGAPIRLVVPWKYGFKNIKSIVKIDLVEEMPVSFWMAAAPSEYGFYANVNPEVAHPRWSQATEKRLGEPDRRPTLPFNGYGDQVAQMYQGMNLTTFF
jgi:sulfoxide reductase catalytic subunit YedY